MQSHELARELLGRDDATLVFQVGQPELESGQLLPDILDIGSTDDGRLVIEVADVDHPSYEGETAPADIIS